MEQKEETILACLGFSSGFWITRPLRYFGNLIIGTQSFYFK